MKPARLHTIAPSILTLTLAASALSAQEVVELPGRDQRIDPDFEEVYRVGVLDGESWEMFGQVNQVAFDAEGNLYVFDGTSGLMGSGDLRVLVFDVAGGFLREFGSWGGGPGEFNRPVAFAVLRDGTTVVSDAGHGAYQLFDASGAFQRMVRAGDELGMWVSEVLRPDPRGGAVFGGDFEGGLGPSIGSPGSDGATSPTSRPVTRVGLDDEVAHTDTVVKGWLPTRDNMDDLVPNNVPAQLRHVLARTDWRRSSNSTKWTCPAWWCGGCRPRFAEPGSGPQDRSWERASRHGISTRGTLLTTNTPSFPEVTTMIRLSKYG